MQITTSSPRETREFAARLARLLRPGDILAYRGGMGAGKTTFTVGLAQGLGIDAWVSSPTFALVHEYRGASATLCHFDMYRVATPDDLYSTGFFDYLDGERILAVEWSENIASELPREAIDVYFEDLGGDSRRITVKGDARFADTCL